MERRGEDGGDFLGVQAGDQPVFDLTATLVAGGIGLAGAGGGGEERNARPHAQLRLGQISGQLAQMLDAEALQLCVVHGQPDLLVRLAARSVPRRFFQRICFSSPWRSGKSTINTAARRLSGQL